MYYTIVYRKEKERKTLFLLDLLFSMNKKKFDFKITYVFL